MRLWIWKLYIWLCSTYNNYKALCIQSVDDQKHKAPWMICTGHWILFMLHYLWFRQPDIDNEPPHIPAWASTVESVITTTNNNVPTMAAINPKVGTRIKFRQLCEFTALFPIIVVIYIPTMGTTAFQFKNTLVYLTYILNFLVLLKNTLVSLMF